jgi:hypothetical protein
VVAFLLRLEPRLGAIEHSEVTPHLELALFQPELGLVDFAVVGIQDGATLVAIATRAEILDDDETDDRLVLVLALTRGAGLRLARSGR